MYFLNSIYISQAFGIDKVHDNSLTFIRHFAEIIGPLPCSLRAYVSSRTQSVSVHRTIVFWTCSCSNWRSPRLCPLASSVSYSYLSSHKLLAIYKDDITLYCVPIPGREGQKVPATIFFLFTWVHLYKGGSVYIKYKPLSFMPCNMGSVARLVALRH